MSKKTFEEWMRQVDFEIEKQIGLSSLDLPDLPYSDMYEDGISPKSAAKKALRNAE